MTEPIAPIEKSVAGETTGPADNMALERVRLPRIAIQFCTQCRWMLRAAYFAQELLSTFSTDLGEVALVPVTGGVFTVTIWHAGPSASGEAAAQETLLWDRKRDGGFPEVKALKSMVRNIIAPERDLGHTDRALKKAGEDKKKQETAEAKKDCEDCQ
ncbi:uncharacterized protein N7498_001438 [Penicillium cinerascens]|uniref:Selenoprotein W-like protein n=1 Tax=Penicillium cinerascens TaxID=70096 RepID=A0A9W9NIM3_9EURO|nr:uncharacterized protein N7498_001438 [Penicillium cinerascens]KAJ5219339.1 hypothetical protein N7498_001438 [Penicillium cinerascens]